MLAKDLDFHEQEVRLHNIKNIYKIFYRKNMEYWNIPRIENIRFALRFVPGDAVRESDLTHGVHITSFIYVKIAREYAPLDVE